MARLPAPSTGEGFSRHVRSHIMMQSASQHPSLPVVTPGQSVPVYTCHVLVSGPSEQVEYRVSVTSLPGFTATVGNERELLTRLVEQFKRCIIEHRQQGQPVPWIEAPERPANDERQRWIPVHL